MSAIGSICQLVRFVVTGASLVQDASEIPTVDDDIKVVRIAATVVRGLCLTASLTASAEELIGASNDVLRYVHGIEEVACLLSFPFQVADASCRCIKGTDTFLQAIERGLIAPSSAIARTFAQDVRSQYKALLDLPPDQRLEQVYRMDWDGDEWTQVFDHNRIVPETECYEMISAYEEVLLQASVVEISAGVQGISNTGSKVINTYQNVIDQIYREAPQPLPAAIPVIPPPVPPPPPQVAPDEIDPLEIDFLRLSFIPAALHQDLVFCRFICPISCGPIRHPVKDPNGTTLYERDEIAKCILVDGKSPITRNPLTIDQLLPAPILQEMIDERLRFYQKQIRIAVKAGLVTPAPLSLLNRVKVENPNYE